MAACGRSDLGTGSVIGLAMLMLAAGCAAGAAEPGPAATAPQTTASTHGDGPDPGTLTVVGHDPLRNRGMNAALAVHGDHAYIGFRSDDSHPHPEILIVDISDPAQPHVAGDIGPPDAANPAESSRELRTWPAQDLLISLHLPCDSYLHACRSDRTAPTFRFFDVAGENATSPVLVASYEPPPSAHEFFLWADPADPDRGLVFVSFLAGVVVLDISQATQGEIVEVATWHVPARRSDVHSVSVSSDGRRAYVAAMGDGVAILDTSELAEHGPDPTIREITSPTTRPTWEGPGVHSAVAVPGTGRLLTTDEAYGIAAGGPAATGCPWGWMRIIDARDERSPQVVAEYRADPWNTTCPGEPTDEDVDRHRFASYSSHNPTVTEQVALITWHGAGLQVVDIHDLQTPRRLATFVPEPLTEVLTEDPGLTAGATKVAMWSYPVIQDGLIYVVDVRNGLYILRYTGPFDDALSDLRFLEGNSNIGGR